MIWLTSWCSKGRIHKWSVDDSADGFKVPSIIQSYDKVGRVVHGVVFSLTQLMELNSIELVLSSLTERYTSES